METQSALVRPDGTVELDTEAPVDPDLAAVVHPRHPELDDTLRLHNALHHALFDILGVCLYHRLQGLQHLLHRLVKLRFTRVTADYRLHQL